MYFLFSAPFLWRRLPPCERPSPSPASAWAFQTKYGQIGPNTAKYAKYGQIYLPAIETPVTGLNHSGTKSSLWQARDGPRHRTRVQGGRQGE